MRQTLPLASLLLCFLSCTKDEPSTPADLSPGIDWITLKSSTYKMPFNENGVAILSAYSNLGYEVTDQTTFYANDQQLDHNKFIPKSIGTYSITGKYKDLTNSSFNIEVQTPINHKILIESFTSRTCGFCPWIGTRLDSLDDSNKNVISYSIHGQDELEVSETYPLQELLSVYARPAVRTNRAYFRDFDAPIEIKELLDSVQYFLSHQAKMELSIESEIHQQEVSVQVSCKYYEEIKDDIYLTLVFVEDSIITQDQYNYFSGYSWTYCPFASLPFYLPEYINHNVLRKVISDPSGDLIQKVPYEYGKTQELGSYTFSVDNKIDMSKASLIAIVHRHQDGIEVSTVLNAQQVKVGQNIGFDE